MSFETIYALRELLVKSETTFTSTEFREKILTPFARLKASGAVDVEQEAFNREIKTIENLIIQKIESHIEDYLIPAIKAKSSAVKRDEIASWKIDAQDFLEEDAFSKISSAIEYALNYARLGDLMRSSISELTRFWEEVEGLSGTRLDIHTQGKLRDVNRDRRQIMSLQENLTDLDKEELNPLISEYAERFEDFKKRADDIHIRVSEANTLFVSGKYQELIEEINNRNGEFDIPTSLDFDYITGKFKNNLVEKGVEKSEALRVTTDRWRIFSEYKYTEYVNELRKLLPADIDNGALENDPYDVRAKWEENISKNLMPLDKLGNPDVVQLAKNFNHELKLLINRYDGYIRVMNQIAHDPDFLGQYRKLKEYRTTIEKEAPILKELWQEKLKVSSGLVNEYLAKKLMEYREQFVVDPLEVSTGIGQDLQRIDESAFSVYTEKLRKIHNASEAYRVSKQVFETINDPQKVLDQINQIESDLVKQDLALPNDLKEKRYTFISWLNPIQTADRLLGSAKEKIASISDVDNLNYEEILNLKEDVTSFLKESQTREGYGEFSDIQERVEDLTEAKADLDQIISYFHIQKMLSHSATDLKRIKSELDGIKNDVLLEKLNGVSDKVKKWDRDDTRVVKQLEKIRDWVNNGEMASLLKAYFTLNELTNIPTTRSAEIGELRDEIVYQINTKRESFLKSETNQGIGNQVLSDLKSFYMKELPGTDKLIEYSTEILEIQARSFEAKKDWFNAYLEWQEVLKIKPDSEEVKARIRACLKFFVIGEAMDKNFIQPKSFDLHTDPDIYRIEIYQRVVELKDTLTDIHKVDAEHLQKLRKMISEIQNTFALDTEVDVSESIDFRNVMIQYEQSSLSHGMLSSFRETFDHHKMVDELEQLRDVCSKMILIMDKMKMSNSLLVFYSGRELVDQVLSEESDLSPIGKDQFRTLWRSHRTNLLTDLAGGSE